MTYFSIFSYSRYVKSVSRNSKGIFIEVKIRLTRLQVVEFIWPCKKAKNKTNTIEGFHIDKGRRHSKKRYWTTFDTRKKLDFQTY